MARITIEDCLKTVDNRFELVLLASKRAKQLLAGRAPMVDDNNKCVVTALREIAGALVTKDNIDSLSKVMDNVDFTGLAQSEKASLYTEQEVEEELNQTELESEKVLNDEGIVEE